MRSIFLLSLSNFRKNKLQNFLIGIILFISALVFTTSAGTLTSINDLYQKTFDNLNASHEIIWIDGNEYNIDKIEEWFINRAEVLNVSALAQVGLEYVYINGRKFSKSISLVEMPAGKVKQDKLFVIEGQEKSKPGIREVWVPVGIAYARDIKPGDIMTIPTTRNPVELRVSAIVVDPLFSNNLISPGRFWLAPGELTTIFSYS